MPQVAVLLLAACGTALATGLGAIPVFLLGRRAAALTPPLLGFAAGVMGVAAVAGLLIPAFQEGSVATVIVGLATGLGFLLFVRRRFSADAGFMGRSGPGARTSGLVFLVLFVHSLPEGLAIGTAFASDRAGLSLFVIRIVGRDERLVSHHVRLLKAAGLARSERDGKMVMYEPTDRGRALLAAVAAQGIAA